MKLTQRNNCNVIDVVDDTVNYLINTTDFSNVSNIMMIGSVNNCQVVEYPLSYINDTLVLPTGVTQSIKCETVDSCATNLIYANVYGDLKTEINTNVQLQQVINSTSSTLSFCGLSATTAYGATINAIKINTSLINLTLNVSYVSNSTDYSSNIKSDIETLLTTNNIAFNSVVVTVQFNNSRPAQSRYTITINSNYVMTGEIVTNVTNYSFTALTGCANNVYGYNHKRSTFTVNNFDNSNTALIKWYTDLAWNYDLATGVYIESYNDSTFNICYNSTNTFTIFMEVLTIDNQLIKYQWTFNPVNQQILNTIATKNIPHYSIVLNGDINNVIGTKLVNATSNVVSQNACINYLHLSPAFFNVTGASFPDSIYALKIIINYKNGTSLSSADGIFMNCVLKCAVADCIYNTKSYELMTYYNALVALSDCADYYVSEMSDLFNLIVNSLCYPIDTITQLLNNDCGCN